MLNIESSLAPFVELSGESASLTRRLFLRYCGAAALGSLGACVPAVPRTLTVRGYEDRVSLSHVGARGRGLRDYAAAAGLLYGAAVDRETLEGDMTFAGTFVRECSLLVPENELKWGRIRPAPDTFDFTTSDWLIDFAIQQGLRARGHTLCWHGANPAWLSSVVTRRNAERILTDHIDTVVRRYRGRVHSWDVVNEVMNPADGRVDGLRKTIWLDRLGPSYIETAFHAAAEADPDSLLVYNENDLTYSRPENATKRKAVIRLLEHLVARGIPVHGLGIQSHLVGDEESFDPREFRSFLREVEQLGLKILITELEVSDRTLPQSVEIRDREVAAAYAAYLSTVLECEAVVAVVTWGLSDRHSWLRSFRPRRDGLAVRPLPLDDQYVRKPAWDAIASAFARAAATRRQA